MDNERFEEREEGPLAREIDAPIPANPRPGTMAIVATTAEYGKWRLSRVGLTLDDAIEEELADYRAGLRGAADHGIGPDAYAAGEPDVALWEGERCMALIRPRAGGDPEVTRFDQAEEDRPLPTTIEERFLLGVVREYGVEPCRKAILEKLMPGYGPGPRPAALTREEESVLFTARTIGAGEAMDRILMMGPYQVIFDACKRLGSDAVAELRKMAVEHGTGR